MAEEIVMTQSADTDTLDNAVVASTSHPFAAVSAEASTAAEQEAIHGILVRLQAQTGHDLGHYQAKAQPCAHYGFDFWQAIETLLDDVGKQQRTARTLERIADLIPNGIAIYDRTQAQTVFANRALAKAYDRSAADLLRLDAATYTELVHPEDRPDVLAEVARLDQLADDEVLEIEFRERTPTGDYRWLNERTVVFARDAAGQVTQQLAVTTDITARKQVESALQGSQQFIEYLLSVTPSLLYIYDLLEQRNIFVNRSIYTTLGYQLSPDEALRAGFVTSIMHPADVAGYTAYLAGLEQLADGQTASFDYRLRHANGAWYWFHSQDAIFLRTKNGTVRQIVGTATDITRHKSAEEHVRRQAERQMLLSAVTRLILESPAAGPALTNALFAQVRTHLDADICLNYRIDDGALHLVTSVGVPPPFLADAQRLEMNQAFCGTVAATCQPLMANRDRIMSDPKGKFVRDLGIRAYACHPLFAGDGRPLGTLSFASTRRTDFTADEMDFLQTICHFMALAWERQQVTDALQATEARFLLAEQASNGWVYDVDVSRGTVQRSASFYQILGYTPAEVPADIGWWHALFHPNDRHLITAEAIRTRSRQAFIEVDYRIRHRAGHYVHVLDRSRVLHDDNGRRLRIVGIAVDISERKRAELDQQFLSELGIQLRLLSDPETILARLVSGLGRHLQVTGCRINEIDLANQQFTVQRDWAATGLLSSGTYPLAELAPPAVLAELALGHTVVITNTARDPRTASVNQTYLQTQVMAFVGVPILDQGQWRATLSVKTDRERQWRQAEIGLLETIASQFRPLLEKVRAEDALRQLNIDLENRVADRTTALEQMNQELARSNRELEQFNYAAAHDLKSPLRGIQHLVQWISEDAAAVLSPQSQKHLTLLRGRVQRLETLLDDMLAYSRIGRVYYAPERLDLNVVVLGIMDVIAPPDGFTVSIPEPLPTLITKRVPLEIILRNLISNAIKHHHQPHQGQVQVQTHTVGNGWIQFSIQDNGPGVAAQFHERIFGMFQTLQPRDQVEGSGVGLALVKKTVESYGGQISIESTIGQGAIFRFTWPIG